MGKATRSPVTPAQVGARLRETRQRLGLSLAEVHDRTGILWRELEALEAGDLRKVPDRQAGLVALHRYAAHIGLDEWPMARVLERHWPQSTSSYAPAVMSTTSPARGPGASMGAGFPVRDPVDSGTQADPITEDPTAMIFGVGTGALHSRYLHPRTAHGAAPVPLQVAVWLVALLVVVGGGGLAAKHGVARWLGDFHWGPAPTPTFAASQNVLGSVAAAASKPDVVLVSSGIASAVVSVRAPQFSVVIMPTAPCWVKVTAGSSAEPVFAGTLQPGDEKIIDAVGGQLTVQLGAGGVTVHVQVRGQTVPGWSFRPSVAPLTVSFNTTSDS
ncbi:MAG: helix-turn-helix domain-containing protein [Acidimicrobiales bacterium]